MDLSDIRRKLVNILAVSVLIAPLASMSQSDFESRAEWERQILGSIEAEQLQNGPYSEELISPLIALSMRYEEIGAYVLADETSSRALQVLRANYGVHSLEQAALLRQLVNRQLLRGSVAVAWDIEQELLALAERHPDDLQTARILQDTADRRMDILGRYTAGEFPQEILLGCYYYDFQLRESERACDSGSSVRARKAIMAEARSLYAESVNIILRNEDYSNEELPVLLMDLVQSSYRSGQYDLGRHSLQYLIAYETSKSSDWLTRIEAIVQLGDWELLYSQHEGTRLQEKAFAIYEQAHSLLEEHGIANESIEELLFPPLPVVLPSFVSNPLDSQEQSGSRGYIDVSFAIAADGKGKLIEILDTNGDTTRTDERNLERIIKRSRFRPRLLGNGATDAAPVTIRYYLNE